ncbi:MAG: glycosyl transferase family 8 [Candidatus Micrarchaeota archaeon]
MKNAIFTCSDAKFGDFLANHWLKSLKENVDLSNTDVVILDYGFSKEQSDRLSKENVIIVKGKRDGHVTSIRFRDMAIFLEKHAYDQVLSTDGGDIIFQADLKELFEKNKDSFRAVTEDFNLPFGDLFTKNFFSKETVEKIKKTLKGKKMINAGVVVAPHKKFLNLAKEINELVIDKSKFGPDQVAVNYILYRDGFKELDKKFNFVFTTCALPFSIKDGEFLLPNGEKIPIVHNAGGSNTFRPIENFGYGKDFNRLKWFTYWGARVFTRLVHSFKR